VMFHGVGEPQMGTVRGETKMGTMRRTSMSAQALSIFNEDVKSMRQVGFKFQGGLLSVKDVDNTFIVDMELFFHWDEPSLKTDSNLSDTDKIQAVPLSGLPFVPQCIPMNANGFDLQQEIAFAHKPSGTAFYSINWTVTFRELLELYRFPFDRQFLSINWYSSNCDFRHWSSPLSPPNFPHTLLGVCTGLGNWRLEGIRSLELNKDQHNCVHSVGFKVALERRVPYYFWNVVFVLFLLVLVSFSVVGISITDTGTRLSVSVTFVLAAVAYKYVIAYMLPAVSYLTLLDRYVVVALFIVIFQVIETYVLGHVAESDGDTANLLDTLYAGFGAGLWAVGHVLLVLGGYRGCCRVSWDKTDQDDNSGMQWAASTGMGSPVA